MVRNTKISHDFFLEEHQAVVEDVPNEVRSTNCNQIKLGIKRIIINKEKYYNTSFVMHIVTKEEEGLYNLYFHNCPNYNYQRMPVSVDFTVSSAFSLN